MKNEIRHQSFWSSPGLGTTDTQYRNQINYLSFEIYHSCHSREFKKKKKEKSLNQCINLYLFLKKITYTYTHCCYWSWLNKMLEKIIIKVHGILCWHEFIPHSIIPLRRMLIWVKEQKGECLIINSKWGDVDFKVTITAFQWQTGST